MRYWKFVRFATEKYVRLAKGKIQFGCADVPSAHVAVPPVLWVLGTVVEVTAVELVEFDAEAKSRKRPL